MQPHFASSRLRREARTVELLIRRFCRDHHQGGKDLCAECQSLLAYARKRLAACPFQAAKPTCGNCTVHCYAPSRRQQIKAVMRHSGPRLLRTNPYLALMHLLDGLRRPPSASDRSGA